MKEIDIDNAIRQHVYWRRQFLNAFADGEYADMPLSEHRGCMLAFQIRRALKNGQVLSGHEVVLKEDESFHDLANEIIDLSNNGLGHSADLLLPQLTEASYRLIQSLDHLRTSLVVV